MTYQNIYASETDANSPLNQTLMDKIREDIGSLAANPVLLSMEAEASATVYQYTWTVIKSGMIFVPEQALTLQAKVECYISAGASDRSVRLKLEDGSGGYQYSDQQGPTAGSYGYETLTLPESGSLAGAGDWRKFWIEARHTEATPRTVYVRKVMIKVGQI